MIQRVKNPSKTCFNGDGWQKVPRQFEIFWGIKDCGTVWCMQETIRQATGCEMPANLIGGKFQAQ